MTIRERIKRLTKRKYEHYNNEFYHSRAWKQARQKALARDHYLCQICLQRGEITPATTVHHIKPIRADGSTANKLNPNNLITVCAACHNALHREKPMAVGDKQRKIKGIRRGDVKVFKANPEQW